MDKKSKLIFLATIFIMIGVAILLFIFDPYAFFITSGRVKKDLQSLGYKDVEIIDRHWVLASYKCPSLTFDHPRSYKLGPVYIANYDVQATDSSNQIKILNVCVSNASDVPDYIRPK